VNYKTYMIVDTVRDDVILEDETVEKYLPREEAIKKFVEKFPHVDMKTVEICLFRGAMIDSFTTSD